MSFFISTFSSSSSSLSIQFKHRNLLLSRHLCSHKCATGSRNGTRTRYGHGQIVWNYCIGIQTNIKATKQHGRTNVKDLVAGKVIGNIGEGRRIATEFDAYTHLVQECMDLGEGRRVHLDILNAGIEIGVYLGNLLISMYAKCASMKDARQMFDKMAQRDVVSWNSVISGYVQNGYGREAVKVFQEMRCAFMKPNKFTFISVLRACAILEEIEQGRKVHAFILKTEFVFHVTVRNALIAMYAKCGSMDDAKSVFASEELDLVSWNTMIMGYVHNGQQEKAFKLFCKMKQADVVPDVYTYASTLSSCANFEFLENGEQVHAHTIRTGFELNLAVANILITMYTKHQKVEHARRVFDRMPKRDVVSWNAMIAGYAQNGYDTEVFKLIRRMQSAGMKLGFMLNEFTFASVLRVCASLSAVDCGMELHGHIIKTGFETNVFVGSALVDMYCKCRSVEDANKIFNAMPEQNLVSWNALIAGYTQNGLAEKALKHFSQMLVRDVKPNHFTFASILKVCASIRAVGYGKVVHAHIIKSGVEFDVFVGSALVDMYAKSELIESAARVFQSMPNHNIVSWNTMITGYVQNRHSEEALCLFCQMQQACITPDNFNLASILGACADITAFGNGQQVHALIIKTGFYSDDWVGSALVDMCVKCGSMADARKVFDEFKDPDVVSLTVMIAAYAQHGNGNEALQLFEQMQSAGMIPDDITFMAVLSACSQAGLMSKGHEYFHSMSQHYGITPRLEHYACMVDLFGRVGCLDEAERFIKGIPFEPSALVWHRLLVACRYHNDMVRGKLVIDKILKMESENSLTYLLLSSIHTSVDWLEEVGKVQKLMNERGVKIELEQSWIEIRNRVHTFIGRDRSHPQTDKIYAKLEELTKQIKNAGYAPSSKVLIHECEDNQNEHHLCYHSEMLAFSFGLITMPLGVPIRIFKNIHVSDDCHRKMKFVSKVVEREIILRDLDCFHHFKNGLCSCGDYW